MTLYRKKPVVIEAVQWEGDNEEEIREFVGPMDMHYSPSVGLLIHTLEGDHQAIIGDYIIRGVAGEFYPCKEDIFYQTYDKV